MSKKDQDVKVDADTAAAATKAAQVMTDKNAQAVKDRTDERKERDK